MNNIIIVGSTTIDEIRIKGKTTVKPGGVPVYAGLTWIEQGVIPIIVSNVAQEDILLYNFFDEHGMTLHGDKSAGTTRFINSYQGDVREQSVQSLAEPISLDHLRKAMHLAHHIHFGPLHPDDIAPVVYGPDLGNKIITCDVQGLTRKIEDGKVTQAVSPYIREVLRHTHIVKADEAELQAVLEHLKMDVYECLREFNIHEIVMTRADNGGIVYQEHQEHPYAACPKYRIVDTTGAGDVFFAAFLYARIYRHQSVATACLYAATIAASHIEGDYISDILVNST